MNLGEVTFDLAFALTAVPPQEQHAVPLEHHTLQGRMPNLLSTTTENRV